MKGLNKIAAGLFFAILLLVLSVICFCFENTSFSHKRVFAASQGAMMLGGALAIGLLCMATNSPERGQEKPRRWLALLPWLVLLAVQLVLCFYAYFITGWDVRGIVESAYAIAGGDRDIHAAYLSMYPNNIPLVMIFAAVIRVLRLALGNPGLDRCIYVLIACQCVLNTLTGMLCHRIAARATGSKRLAWSVAIVYAAFVGLSPWLMIPYSDSMALVFPTAVIAVYQANREGKLGLGAWPLMGLLAAVGYMIKPQAVIAAIAVLLLETARLILDGQAGKGLRQAGSMALVLVMLAGPGTQLLIKASPIEIRPERSMGMLHFAMMGLNTETNGVYAYDDVQLSSSAKTNEERRQIQMEEIGRRLSSMTAGDMLEHLKKKTLTNYADGSFAWGCEGDFYSEQIEDKDAVLSPFLKSLIDIDSSRFTILLAYLHSIWLALLLGCALCGAAYCMGGQEDGGVLPVMMLSIVGLTLFEWIFEARARYLYTYAPFYVLLGVVGWQRLTAWLKRKAIRR